MPWLYLTNRYVNILLFIPFKQGFLPSLVWGTVKYNNLFLFHRIQIPCHVMFCCFNPPHWPICLSFLPFCHLLLCPRTKLRSVRSVETSFLDYAMGPVRSWLLFFFFLLANLFFAILIFLFCFKEHQHILLAFLVSCRYICYISLLNIIKFIFPLIYLLDLNL